MLCTNIAILIYVCNMNKLEFEKRLLLCGLLQVKKKNYNLWCLTDAIFIRSRKSGYSIHLWVDTDGYVYRKQLYSSIDFSCTNDRFLLNLLGKKNVPASNDIL